MGAVLLVEGIQIGGVLEVVGVHLTALGDQVGLDVIGVLDDLQRDALLSQNVLGNAEDLGMGHRGGGHLDGGAGQVVGLGGGLAGDRLRGDSLGGGGFAGGSGGGGGAAGGQAQGQRTCEDGGKQLFHDSFSFCFKMFFPRIRGPRQWGLFRDSGLAGNCPSKEKSRMPTASCFRFLSYASDAQGETSTECHSTLHMHIIMERLLRYFMVRFSFPQKFQIPIALVG